MILELFGREKFMNVIELLFLVLCILLSWCLASTGNGMFGIAGSIAGAVLGFVAPMLVVVLTARYIRARKRRLSWWTSHARRKQ
jgi:predicted branched-subunit amino acid permease